VAHLLHSNPIVAHYSHLMSHKRGGPFVLDAAVLANDPRKPALAHLQDLRISNTVCAKSSNSNT